LISYFKMKTCSYAKLTHRPVQKCHTQ
jgi:hypothetical protein